MNCAGRPEPSQADLNGAGLSWAGHCWADLRRVEPNLILIPKLRPTGQKLILCCVFAWIIKYFNRKYRFTATGPYGPKFHCTAEAKATCTKPSPAKRSCEPYWAKPCRHCRAELSWAKLEPNRDKAGQAMPSRTRAESSTKRIADKFWAILGPPGEKSMKHLMRRSHIKYIYIYIYTYIYIHIYIYIYIEREREREREREIHK